jgi:hypothetical protein
MKLQAVILCALSVAVVARANGEQHRTDELLPTGAKIYVAPMPNGFDSYVVAGLQEKKVPVIIVTDRSQADYEVSGGSESDKAGWVKMLLLQTDNSTEKAGIKVVNLATGNMMFTYAVIRPNATHGKQTTGEAVAKHIKERVTGSAVSNVGAKYVPAKPISTISKVYISDIPDKFGNYLKAAIQAKKVPIVVVDSKNEADFEITGHAATEKAGCDQKILMGDRRSNEEVSIQVNSLKTGHVVYAYSVNLKSSNGQKSPAEVVAKQLKKNIQKGVQQSL